VRVKDAGFALGAQWHPEFRATENPDSLKLFQAFGAAARERNRQRRARQAAAA
jgi:putative glutamine amidotransferase